MPPLDYQQADRSVKPRLRFQISKVCIRAHTKAGDDRITIDIGVIDKERLIFGERW